MVSFIALALSMFAYGSEAESLLLRGQVERAAIVAKAEAEAAPEDVGAQELFIDLLLTTGLAPLAEQIYQNRVNEDPLSPDNHYLLGRALVAADRAQAAYEHALKFDPNHARSHMGMGAIHRSRGAVSDSERAYRRALDLDSTLSEAWAGLTTVLVIQGRQTDALAVARDAMEAVPNEAGPYLSVAVLDPAHGVEVLAKGVKTVPSDPLLYEALAEMLLGLGKGEEAKSAIDQALNIDGSRPTAIMIGLYAASMSKGLLDAEGYHKLVDARRMVGEDPVSAMVALNNLVAGYTGCGLVYLARAQAARVLGDFTAAEADLRRALSISPDSFEARAALGMLLANQGRNVEALSLLKYAHKLAPSDIGLTVSLANAELSAGDPASARTLLEEAYQRYPTNQTVVLAFAGVLAHYKDKETAYRVLKEATVRTMDGRIALSLAAAARDIGRYEEAADLLLQLGEQSGSSQLLKLAEEVRIQGEAAQ